MKRNAREESEFRTLLAAAGGRCQCQGECGGTHLASDSVRPIRCGVMHDTRIVRHREFSSAWMLAPTAHADQYTADVTLVKLTCVDLDDASILMCGYCRQALARRAS